MPIRHQSGYAGKTNGYVSPEFREKLQVRDKNMGAMSIHTIFRLLTLEVVAHTCNSSTWKIGQEDQQVPGQPWAT
jgi:hypothetical protein